MLPRDLLRRLTVSLHYTIQHCYHLLEMLPRVLLRRLTVSLHYTIQHCYHLLEMLPRVLLRRLTVSLHYTIQQCYHLLEMLPRDLLRRLTVSLQYTIQHCYHLLEMLPRVLLRRLTVSLQYTIQHCYHLLEMLLRDLLRRITVSLHKYHSTLLQLAWDETPGLAEASYCLLTQVPFNIVTTCLRCYPGLVEASYCLLTQVPFNTVTTCLRCYPGTCWGVLLSPYTSTIQHCYHLLEMLPRDLLRRLTVSLHKYHSTLLPFAWDATPGRRLTVSLHKYHSTLLPLAWDATPGLVDASICLLTQVPFNIVTTCLRCYPGTRWDVLLSPYTSTIQHCQHLREMLPRDLLGRLTVSLHKYHSTLLPLAWDATQGLVEASYCLLTQVPFNTVTTCLRCYPGTCWGVILSPYVRLTQVPSCSHTSCMHRSIVRTQL